jgi:hypothetical protein
MLKTGAFFLQYSCIAIGAVPPWRLSVWTIEAGALGMMWYGGAFGAHKLYGDGSQHIIFPSLCG